jgi:hypothetical protein
MKQQPDAQIPDPGLMQVSAVLLVDLLPGTRAYSDTFREAPPILVIVSGGTELQLGVAGQRVTLEDLASIDTILEAAAAFRTDLLALLQAIKG